MLTQTEKQILGYMVDMGVLRGQERINAGANYETARELISNFSTQMQLILPQKIINLQAQQQNIAAELVSAQDLLGLL